MRVATFSIAGSLCTKAHLYIWDEPCLYFLFHIPLLKSFSKYWTYRIHCFLLEKPSPPASPQGPIRLRFLFGHSQLPHFVLAINKTNIEVQQGNFSSWWENKKRQDTYELSENERLKKDIKRLWFVGSSINRK